ncbi:MAG: hypothetical protein IJU27_06165 [Bacteroidales bacterium]|nr:hypothetical protein [Bacteroidales bacterium]
MKRIIGTIVLAALLLCSCKGRELTAELAYQGVSNYCKSEFDWSSAEDNPSLMSVEMGEETDSEWVVVFRSYTGALTYFHVDKATGSTRMEEYVPILGLRNDAGTIDLFDYIP